MFSSTSLPLFLVYFSSCNSFSSFALLLHLRLLYHFCSAFSTFLLYLFHLPHLLLLFSSISPPISRLLLLLFLLLLLLYLSLPSSNPSPFFSYSSFVSIPPLLRPPLYYLLISLPACLLIFLRLFSGLSSLSSGRLMRCERRWMAVASPASSAISSSAAAAN